MKIFLVKELKLIALMSLLMGNSIYAQDASNDRAESSTAILDTSIPFAIGAREGEQSIRSSFGWPTFQEGFVEGVYFRFDPDGYARFSSSPRLDEDVFEVICQAAATICIAKKGGLEIGLTDQGKPQIQISGTTPDDRFFISDRKSELPLPNSILGPIDQRLETLLSSDGELIIRRELETLQKLSLSGFSATVTYLRWVAQNQASFVFPRGWPAPSQQMHQEQSWLTLQDGWNSRSSNDQSNTLIQQSRNLQQNTGATIGANANTQSSQTNVGNYELSAIEFAQQAQARNLTADVNKFVNTPETHNRGQAHDQNTSIRHSQNIAASMEIELSNINQSIRDIEIRIRNLNKQVSKDLRYIKASLNAAANGRPDLQQGLVSGLKNTQVPLSPDNMDMSEEEKLRKIVVENLLQQSKQVEKNKESVPNLPTKGEISVKKNIVERLLEELNSTKTETQDLPETKVQETSEFISLSDYINKVMQDEKAQ